VSKFDEKVEFYKGKMKDLGIKVDADLLHAATKACGPSIYNRDAETVSGSDPKELGRVKNNFLKKKLGLTDSDDLDGMIAKAIDVIGKSNRSKYRAIMYYLLSQQAGKTP